MADVSISSEIGLGNGLVPSGANVDSDLCHHMALLGYNGLKPYNAWPESFQAKLVTTRAADTLAPAARSSTVMTSMGMFLSSYGVILNNL